MNLLLNILLIVLLTLIEWKQPNLEYLFMHLKLLMIGVFVCIGEYLEGIDSMLVTNQFDWERLVILDLLDQGVLRLCK